MVRAKLKEVLKDFAENTTAHAPPKILTHTHILSKIFWALLFMTGLGVFVYFSRELISDYLKFEKTTDIELRFSVLEFPAVTVCNQNQFRRDRLPTDLSALLDDFMLAKREDMFGGKDKFDDYMRDLVEMAGGGPTGGSSTHAPATASDDKDGPTNALTSSDTGTAAASPTAPAASPTAPAASPTTAAASPTTAAATPSTAAASPTTAAATPTTAAASPTTAAATPTTAAATPTTASPSSTTAAPQPTAATTNQPSTSPAGPAGRKRRAIEALSEEENLVIDDLVGFYQTPKLDDMTNMTWFDNMGETSSEKTIILNLTQYITTNYDKQTVMEAGHDIQEMLQECVFLGKTCGPSDFYHFYDMKYGNCYTFNSGMNRTVARITNPGASFGLSMTMFINQEQYIPVLTQDAGLRVMLHRQGQVPIMEEDGFDVSPGTKSGIAVKYVEVSRLAGKYSDCINFVNRSNTHEYYPGNYTQKACLKTCLQKGIIHDCGCATPLYRYPDGVVMCGPDDDECVDNVEVALLDNNTCSDQCPTPCWESQYQYVISASQWPSNNYMPYLKESLDERGDTMKSVMASDTRTGLSQQFLKMTVYYDNLNYNRYSERLTITTEDLIGALGGHLGLWIGMSIISFVEFFELILLMLKWCVLKISHNNKTSSMTDLGEEEREKVQTPVHSFANDSWVKEDG